MKPIIRPSWYKPDAAATPESIYWNRRDFIKTLGLGTVSLSSLSLAACAEAQTPTSLNPLPKRPSDQFYPAKLNELYKDVGKPLTPEKIATTYNNYYEFTLDKELVPVKSQFFTVDPWTIEIDGLVDKPLKLDFEDLMKQVTLEERVYRFRCVEAWSMVVPWTGLPLNQLLKLAGPKSSAKYVRFISFNRPSEAPNQKAQPWYPWPYYEGLRIDEAMHDLTLMTTGIYGKPLPRQHGAPLRLIVPWKYGYKSPKGIVRIELVDHKPETFWNKIAPREYGFYSNVNPAEAHPRWSQATERDIATGNRIPTLPMNGYVDEVAPLYAKK